jgi:hypothetical protein
MESEIYVISAAIKGTTPNRGLIGEIGLHDGKATSLSVGSLSSKTVLQGEHAEKNSTGTKYIDRRIMGVLQRQPGGHWCDFQVQGGVRATSGHDHGV